MAIIRIPSGNNFSDWNATFLKIRMRGKLSTNSDWSKPVVIYVKHPNLPLNTPAFASGETEILLPPAANKPSEIKYELNEFNGTERGSLEYQMRDTLMAYKNPFFSGSDIVTPGQPNYFTMPSYWVDQLYEVARTTKEAFLRMRYTCSAQNQQSDYCEYIHFKIAD